MQRRDQWVGGAVLIAIGAGLLLAQLADDAEQYVLPRDIPLGKSRHPSGVPRA